MNYKIQLQGLHCEACKKITQKRLGRLDGITFVDVDIDNQVALLESSNAINQQQVENALKDTDYKVTAFVGI